MTYIALLIPTKSLEERMVDRIPNPYGLKTTPLGENLQLLLVFQFRGCSLGNSHIRRVLAGYLHRRIMFEND